MINRIKNMFLFTQYMHVCHVYLLCIYKDTHTVYILKIFTCIYLYSYNAYYIYVNITYFSEMYACVCI